MCPALLLRFNPKRTLCVVLSILNRLPVERDGVFSVLDDFLSIFIDVDRGLQPSDYTQTCQIKRGDAISACSFDGVFPPLCLFAT